MSTGGRRLPGVLDHPEVRKDGRILQAALVLFGKKLMPDYPQCELRMARFRGLDKTEFLDQQDVRGPAFRLLEEAQIFCRRHFPLPGRIVPGKLQREDKPLIPPDAMREILVNTPIHRDYSNAGGAIYLAIYDDRVEVWSTGGFPSGITPSMLSREHKSILRNPIIAEVFHRAGLIEKWGRGTNRVIAMCRQAGIQPPELRMTTRAKLELTWIGKENRPRLEPRIMLGDPEKSYHAKHRVTDHDLFDNRLIFGDNLLALKALEQEFTGKVKCIFIDLPYNTGSAFTHYDDGVEHSIWLSLMRDRLYLPRQLLSEDGSLWITIDDKEAHYLKVLCDEVFGRNCFIATVIWRSTDNSNNDAKQFSIDHSMVLAYSRTLDWRSKRLEASEAQRRHFRNPDNDPLGPWFDGNPLSSPNPRPNLEYVVVSPTGFQVPPPPNGWRWSRETMDEMIARGEIRFTADGKAVRRRTYLADRKGIP